MEERGFRVREGKHQYRLVELDGEGNMVPVSITDRNTMFFSPKEVQDRIPNMYKEISYKKLLEMQRGKAMYKMKEVETSEIQEAEELPVDQEAIVIKEFFTESQYCMAKVVYQGEETTEGIWRRGEELYITTGWAMEGNLEEHTLSEEQMEQLASYMEAHRWEMTGEFPLLKVGMAQDGRNVEQTNRNTPYLDQLQIQERKINSQMEIVTGMEMAM